MGRRLPTVPRAVVNYVADGKRSTPINRAAGRVIVSALMLLKLVRYDWGVIEQWPRPLTTSYWPFTAEIISTHLPAIAFVTGIALVGVLVGYRLRVLGFVAAVGLTYLGTVRLAHDPSHGSDILFIGAIFVLFFALFAEEDKLSIDQLRRTRSMRLDALTDHLEASRETTDERRYSHSALKWSLALVGVMYFHAAVGKLRGAPLEWIQPTNLGRFIVYRQFAYDLPLPAGELLLQVPLLLTMAAIGTILLEGSILPAIALRQRIDVLFAGLVGMHATIAFAVGPIFTDLVVLLLAFVSWDLIHGWLQRDRDLAVVYDSRCFLCARSLHLFGFLDVRGNVTFYDQESVPDRLAQQEDINLERSMYVFGEGDRYRGYEAFRALFAQFGLSVVISWIMGLPGIRFIGRRVYRHVVAHRSRYFVCAVDPDLE